MASDWYLVAGETAGVLELLAYLVGLLQNHGMECAALLVCVLEHADGDCTLPKDLHRLVADRSFLSCGNTRERYQNGPVGKKWHGRQRTAEKIPRYEVLRQDRSESCGIDRFTRVLVSRR